MEKDGAGVGGLLANLARAAVKGTRATAAAAPALAARVRPAVGDAFAASRPIVGAAASTAAASMRPVARAVAAAPAQAAATAKFVAGVPATQPFAPNLRGAVGNTARLMFRPRYPGLDRVPGAAAMSRPFDRTRAITGVALRSTGVGAMGLSGVAGGAAALKSYPEYLASIATGPIGVARDPREGVKSRAVANAPRFYAALGRQMVGLGDSSPFSQLHADVIRDAAVPLLRYDLHQTRKTRPGLMATIDAMRSTTPAGLLATLGLRSAGSDTPVDMQAIVARRVAENAGAWAFNPNRFSGPFADIYRDVLPANVAADGDIRAGIGNGMGRLGLADPATARRIAGMDEKGYTFGLRPTWGQAARAAGLMNLLLRR